MKKETSTSGSNPAGQRPLLSAIQEFLKLESAGGILLLAATVVAMVVANSPFAGTYESFLQTTVAVQVGALEIKKPLFLWINDGLMAVFFFLIGLEIKREVMEGELSSMSQVVLPALGAIGGMVIPAGIYIWLNWGDSVALDGWAIPVATDIAFALAVLSVFGKRVPTSLTVFLLTLAIFDDLAAIIIIALFYSGDLSLGALAVGGGALAVAIAMNRAGVGSTAAYIMVGFVLWVAVLKSGVHATLAGVLIALCIPMRNAQGDSLVRDLEHNLHGPVAKGILPLFAFANAGIALGAMALTDLTHPVTLGVISGLVIGKPVGIFLFVAPAVLLGIAQLPKGVGWWQLLGVTFACGIGFTMSLFIAGLAFQHGSGAYFAGDRLGILIGSIVSALAALVVLHLSLPRSASTNRA